MNRGMGAARRRVRRRGVVALASLLGMTLVLAACGGGGGTNNAAVFSAGRVDVKLPHGYKVVHGKIVVPKSKLVSASGQAGATAAPGAGGAGNSSIPLDTKQDPTKTLFAAIGNFRSCLDERGVKFIGAPDRSNPDSPTNDPNYINSLSTCAARSNIVEALKASQSANDNLSAAEIKKRNKGYLIWRSCMIDRGWKIPKPVPDAQGRLFSFGGGSGGSSGSGGSGGSQSQIQGPPGKDLLSSSDTQQCAAKSQKAAGQ